LKKAILFIIIIGFLYSCQKSVHDIIGTSPVPPANCRLIKIIQGSRDSSSNNALYEDTIIHIKYDAQGRIAGIVDTIGIGSLTSKPTYDAAGRLLSIRQEETPFNPIYFQYSSNGLLSAIIDSSYFSTNRYTFEYAANNLPVKRTEYNIPTAQGSTDTSYKNYFYDPAGNIIRTIEYGADSTLAGMVTEYTYTENANILADLTPYRSGALYGFFDIMDFDSRFNKKMVSSYRQYQKAFQGSILITNTYMHDSVGRITRIVTTQTQIPSLLPVETHTRFLFYECK